MNKKRSGLTVLEIILSAAIVAVAAAIIAQVFFSSDRLMDRTADNDEATFIAVDLLERMSYEDFQDFFEQYRSGEKNGKVSAAGMHFDISGGKGKTDFSTESGLLVRVELSFSEERLEIDVAAFRDDSEVCGMTKYLHYRRQK